MAIHVIEKLIEVVTSVYGARDAIVFSAPRAGISYARSTVAGTIVKVAVYQAGNVTSGQSAWNLRQNGTALFSGGSRPIITAGNSSDTKTGLAVSTAIGDIFQLDLDEVPAGGVVTPVTWFIFIDDGITANVEGPGSSTNNALVLFDGTTGKLLKDSAKTISTDTALSANSDALLPTQKAVKAYADQLLALADAMRFLGVIDCSANPNYPAADAGDTYRVSVAGKIGGSSGVKVEIGDQLLCLTDSTASGNQATVGANWNITQANIDGGVIGPASATDTAIVLFDGTGGKLVKDSAIVISTDDTLASDSNSKVPTEQAVKGYVDANIGGGGGDPTLGGDVTGIGSDNTVSAVNGRSLEDVPPYGPFVEDFAIDRAAPATADWVSSATDTGTAVAVTSGEVIISRASGTGIAGRIYTSVAEFDPNGKEFIFDFSMPNIAGSISGGKRHEIFFGLVDPTSSPTYSTQFGLVGGKGVLAFQDNDGTTGAWQILRDAGFNCGTPWSAGSSVHSGKFRLWHDLAATRIKLDEWDGSAWQNRISWNYVADSWTIPATVKIFFGGSFSAGTGVDPQVRYSNIETNAIVDAADDGATFIWNKTTGKFELTLPPTVPALASQAEAEAGTENTKIMTALRTKQAITANPPTLAGDVTGAGSANTVTKIRNRTVKNWSPPEFLADDFSGSFDTAKWDFSNNGWATWATSGGDLVFAKANNGFGAQGMLSSKVPFDFTGKTITAMCELDNLKGTRHWTLGIVTSSGKTFNGSSPASPGYYGFRIDYGGGYAAYMSYNGSGWGGLGSLSSPSGPVAGMRMTESGGTFHFYVAYQSAPTVWVELGTYSVGAASLAGKVLCLEAFTEVTSASSINLSDISSTIVSSDEITDGDVVFWNSATQEFETKTISPGATVIDDLTDVDTTTVPPTTGDVLTFDGTDWVPDAPSGGGTTFAVRLWLLLDQVIPNDAWTALSFTTEVRDDGGLHESVTNPTRITIPTGGAGWYSVTAGARFSNSSIIGVRHARLILNGVTTDPIAGFGINADSAFQTVQNLATNIYLADGDYLEVQVYQNRGGDLNVEGYETNFTAVRLS